MIAEQLAPSIKRHNLPLIAVTFMLSLAVFSFVLFGGAWSVFTKWSDDQPESARQYIASNLRSVAQLLPYVKSNTIATLNALGVPLGDSNASFYHEVQEPSARTQGYHYRILIEFWSRVLLALAGALLITRLTVYRPGGTDMLQHVRGPRLYEYRDAIRQANRTLGKELKADDIGEGVRIHPDIVWPYLLERMNYLFLGAPRSGKTATMKPMVYDMIQRGDHVYMYDPGKRENTETFFDPKTTYLISPTDRRSTSWAIAVDCQNEIDAENIAERMIPESSDPMWSNAARLVFTAILVYLQNVRGKAWGWEHVSECLNLPDAELRQIFDEHYPYVSTFIEEGSVTTQGILINMKAFVGFVRLLARAWPKSWERGLSMKAWALGKTKRKVIIIQEHPELRTMSHGLIRATMTVAVNKLYDLPDSKKRRRVFWIDEAGTIKLPDLMDQMSKTSAKGTRYVIGAQDISMLIKEHGRESAQAIRSMIATCAAMRVAGGETAQWLSEGTSKRTVAYQQETRTGPSVSTTMVEKEVPVVAPDEFAALPNATIRNGIHGYLTVAGTNEVYKLKWPIRTDLPLLAKGKGYVPHRWATSEIASIRKAQREASKAQLKLGQVAQAGQVVAPKVTEEEPEQMVVTTTQNEEPKPSRSDDQLIDDGIEQHMQNVAQDAIGGIAGDVIGAATGLGDIFEIASYALDEGTGAHVTAAIDNEKKKKLKKAASGLK